MKKIDIFDILILIAAFSSLAYSELCWFKGEKEAALFVGLWVPSILGFGIYLKLTKQK